MKPRLNILLPLLAFAVLLYGAIFSFFENKDSINSIIGNVSYVNSFGRLPDDHINDSLRIATHLNYVHQLLLDRTEGIQDEAIRNKRFALLALLDEYIQNGRFPQNTKIDHRAPCFIDEFGTICAVGYLVQETAGLHVAQYINQLHQYDYIENMNVKELKEWISSSGFSEKEIAMIQPTYANFYRIRNRSFYIGLGVHQVSPRLSFGNFKINYSQAILNSYSITAGLNYHPLGKRDFNLSLPVMFSHPLLLQIAPGIEPEYYRNEQKNGYALRPSLTYQRFHYFEKIKTSIGVQLNLGYSFALGTDYRQLSPKSLRVSLLIHPRFTTF